MPPTLAAFIAEPARQLGLRPRDDIREPGWTFWELRTLNRHRVVGLVTEHRVFKDAPDLGTEIREVVSRHFRVAWWRGMAYGVAADVPTIGLKAQDLTALVDVRDNSRGTLQWVVLAAGDAHAAVGVHTWIEGYLSPVYQSILQRLTVAGYRVATAVRQKDGLMRFLAAAADVDLALHGFGPRRAFPAFRSDLQTPSA